MMSVTVIDKNSFILSDYLTTTSKKKSKKSSLHKENKVKNDKISQLEDDVPNLLQVNHMNPDLIIDTILETPNKERKRKLSGSTSCSEDSSFSNSPEIKTGSAIIYELSHLENLKIRIKKTMYQNLRSKPKICSDTEITNLVNSEDDETIFDNVKKIDTNKNLFDEKNTIKVNKCSEISRLQPSSSTDERKCKVETINTPTRRVSLRSDINTPSRYRGKNDEITMRRLPARAAKSKLFSDDDGYEYTSPIQETTQSEYKNKKHNKSERNKLNKSQKSETNILSPIGTSRGRIRINNLSRVNVDDDRKNEEKKSDEMNKENESEDSYHSDESERTVNDIDKQIFTPKKKGSYKKDVTTVMSRTRRGMSRIDEMPDDIILNNTPKKKVEIIDEPVTPKRKISVAKSQTPSIKIHTLTPSMSARKTIVEKRKTIFEKVRAQLHVSAVPKSLPCREQEFNDVFSFLKRKLVDYSGGCMYISGVPGTGKTATVNEAIRCLKKLVEMGELENFRFIEINGMKLAEPRQAYVQILKQLTSETAAWEVARSIIEKKLTNPKDKTMTLLLIDELDVLCNKRQDVVYNLLDWPSQQSVKLVVITIANTMDLPERVLMSRVTSRLGLTRLTFQPYNHKQLQEIVITRLNESDAFKSDAVQLVARKVAAVSGDARRALDICRRATEIAENDQSKIVLIKHVNEALTEMIANTKVRAIMHCSEMEKVFLQAICAEVKRTGVEETIFHDVYKQLEALCSFEGEKTPNITESLGICSRLSANRLILCDEAKRDIHRKIILNVSSDDIYFALNNIEI